MKRITANMSEEMYTELSAYREKHKLQSDSAALVSLAANALRVQRPVGQWGGNRWHQCQQCGGWNVGDLGDGIKRCADCGWSSDK